MKRFKIRFSPLTLKRLKRFKRIRRGYYSFLILIVAIIVSCFSEVIANHRALIVNYNGKTYYPIFRYFPGTVFGLSDDKEPNYRELHRQFKEQNQGNSVLLPLIPYGPYEYDFEDPTPPPHAPSHKHWLGTDDRGRDVFVRLLYGFRTAIFFSMILTFMSQAIGTFVGCAMGYFGNWVDLVGQRFIEIWSNVPYLYFVIILASLFNPSFFLLLLIMVLFEWISLTYFMRTEVYREKSKDYCAAALASGGTHWRVIFKHLLPNALVPLVTLFPFQLIGGISSLTALDFLGYGLPPPTPSWGELMKQAIELENRTRIWLSLSPFLAISITLLLVTFIGEALREAFDPKEYAPYQ